MLRFNKIMSVAALVAVFLMADVSNAQRVMIDPGAGGGGGGGGQTGSFYNAQLGAWLEAVNASGQIGGGGPGIGGPGSRPGLLIDPGAIGGGGGGAVQGLRVVSVDIGGIANRFGLERGDIILRSDVTSSIDLYTGGGGNVTTRLQVIDIRTGRTVPLNLVGVAINLVIGGPGTGVGPGTGPGTCPPAIDPWRPVVTPEVDPGGSRPGYYHGHK